MEDYTKEKIIVLGSTGSIGQQTLAVCRRLHLPVLALSCDRSIDLFWQQILEFQPEHVAVADSKAAAELIRRLDEQHPASKVQVHIGMEGIAEIAVLPCRAVVMAIIGFAAIKPMLAAVKAGQTVAMANKEAIVATGAFILEAAEKYHARIYPVDSEPSAIWQSVNDARNPIAKVLLTASGGPFRETPAAQLKAIKPEQALQHPVWSMGEKITIDSATMMNKGLEFIEISRLFQLAADQIEVVVHPEGIIHSAVEFADGAVIAQLGVPDMELPIQYALTYPCRSAIPDKPKLDLTSLAKLSFYKPDLQKFKALALAYEAARYSDGYLPAVLNAANEIAVNAFLEKRLCFTNIPELVEKTMQESSRKYCAKPKNIEDILAADLWAREYATKLTGR